MDEYLKAELLLSTRQIRASLDSINHRREDIRWGYIKGKHEWTLEILHQPFQHKHRQLTP